MLSENNKYVLTCANFLFSLYSVDHILPFCFYLHYLQKHTFILFYIIGVELVIVVIALSCLYFFRLVTSCAFTYFFLFVC